jgi:hypothetical protein
VIGSRLNNLLQPPDFLILSDAVFEKLMELKTRKTAAYLAAGEGRDTGAKILGLQYIFVKLIDVGGELILP